MALFDVNFFSECLGMQTEVYVILPQRQANGEIGLSGAKRTEGNYKTLYLFHGLSDDHTVWLRRTSIERYADRYGIAVVMPAVAKSYYTDMKYGMDYYSYVARELPEKMREFFRLSDKREDNFVAGLSMGGYGALKVAFRECDRFAAVAGLSSAVDMRSRLCRPMMRPVFGDVDEIPEEDDLLRLAALCKEKPRVYLAAGLEDPLYPETQLLRKTLTDLGFDLTYRESHGGHNWDFWDEYIQYVLSWMFGDEN